MQNQRTLKKIVLNITEIFFLGQFEVLQHRGFEIQGKVPAFTRTDRHPAKAHFPAMQIAINIKFTCTYRLRAGACETLETQARHT